MGSKRLLGSIFEPPGLNFRAPGPRFWSLRASIFKLPGFVLPSPAFSCFFLLSLASGLRFWSPRDVILEPLGLDFQASGPCFAFSCFLLLSLAFSCFLVLSLAFSCFLLVSLPLFLLSLPFSCFLFLASCFLLLSLLLWLRFPFHCCSGFYKFWLIFRIFSYVFAFFRLLKLSWHFFSIFSRFFAIFDDFSWILGGFWVVFGRRFRVLLQFFLKKPIF